MRITVAMQLYCGTKIVAAAPMVMQEYFSQSGREIPEELDLKYTRDHPGYLVEYEPEKGKEHGYQSWSPAGPFEKAYYLIDGMPFGVALERCIGGAKIARRTWAGRQYKYIETQVPDKHSKMGEPYLCCMSAAGRMVPWGPSQVECFANDWYVFQVPSTKDESPTVEDDNNGNPVG